MTEKISFSIEDAKLINENPDSNFAVMELDFFASGKNLHDMYVSEETLLRTADSIKNCPLVWKYDEDLDDIYTHTPDEVPCGFVPEHTNITSRILDDGRTMLSVVAYVWKRYTGELLNFFKRDGGVKPVSVEMSVLDTLERPDGLLELLDYKFEGITVLGTFVTPAIPLAKATVLSFSKEYEEVFNKEFSSNIHSDSERIHYQKERENIMPYSSLKDINPAIKGIDPPITLAQANAIARQADAVGAEKGGWGIAIKHFKDSHIVEKGKWTKKELAKKVMAYENIDFSIPEVVKDNASKGLKLRRKYEKGGNNTAVSFARYLMNNDVITPDKIRQIASFFPKHKVMSFAEKDNPSDEYIAWLLWGGDSASEWAKEIIHEMNKQNENRNFAESPKKDLEAKGEKEETNMLEEKEVKEEKMAELEIEVEDKEEEKEGEGESEMAAPMPSAALSAEGMKEFMYPSNFNLDTMMSMFAEKETEEIKYAVDELMRGQFADPSVVMSGMFAKMCKMSEMIQKMAKDSEVYMAENESLKQFKSDMEEKQKMFAVETTIKELAEKVVIPAEAKAEMLAEADKYTFANIDSWKTYCKAKSFDFSVVKTKEHSDVVRVGMPFSGTHIKKEDLWS